MCLCVFFVLQELEITELCYAEAKLAQKPETVIWPSRFFAHNDIIYHFTNQL